MSDTKPKPESSAAGGCLAVIILVAMVAGIIVIVSGGSTTTSRQNAIAYIKGLAGDASRVSANVADVEIEVSTHANINQVAQAAQQAHNNLDAVRNDFATIPDSGNLGSAETGVFTAANDLKDAMGALVAYTGNPNPATLAQFTTQFANARSEWNDGIRTLWRIAGRRGAPTI